MEWGQARPASGVLRWRRGRRSLGLVEKGRASPAVASLPRPLRCTKGANDRSSGFPPARG